MGQHVELTASDGHRFTAYLAEPSVSGMGGVVIVQEIFGLTRHIRGVADQYARAGYLALAPALFDRIERGVDVPYDDIQRARNYLKGVDQRTALLDIDASVERARSAGKVAVVGFCWGGTLAYLAAAQLNIDAAVAYYGGGIDQALERKPRVPVLFHFGERDSHISMDAVDRIRSALPQETFHLYPAEHGFNCNDRASYEAGSAKLAFDRSLAFLGRRLA